MAESPPLQRWARRYGMKLGAGRFVAGETVDQALDQSRLLNRDGYMVTLDLLGEGVTNSVMAQRAGSAYVDLLDDISSANIDSNISVKPTQLGLGLDFKLAFDNVKQIVQRAAHLGNFVRLDMEDSPHVEPILKLYRDLRREWNNLGVVIQAYLYRSWDDLQQLAGMGANVRLVKGAYDEPPHVAYKNKGDVDDNFRNLITYHLDSSGYTAVATHDEDIINFTREYVARKGIPRDRYEFQLLYGVRPGLQERLLRDGERVRIYVPFGPDWYPYFMRRLAERPANLAFVLKNLMRA